MENYETQARGCWTIQKVQKKNPPDSASLYQLSPKYLKGKSGNDPPYNQPAYILLNCPGIRRENPQSCMSNKYLKILENMADFKS